MHRFLFFIFIVLIISASCGQRNAKEEPAPNEEKVLIQKKKADTLFGFAKDSFIVNEGKIREGEFLSNILTRYGVSYLTIDKVARAARPIFDVRYLQEGKPYYILRNKDSIACCFIYQPTAVQYVVYNFSNPDSVRVYQDEKKVKRVEREVAGVINSSLYETMQEIGVNALLALKLADIYAWTIDFYRIQKGDRFKVIFEEKMVDGEFVGIGDIKAAVFYHRNEPFYAFYFDDSSAAGYYDEKGVSVRKAFLKSPVKFSTLTSRYSLKRYHPILKRVKAHLGTDYAAPYGTPILSTADGVVIAASYTRGNGNYVKIRHNSTYTTQYLHMKNFAKGVRPGKVVKQGDVIGYVGSTGLATGPHVCYRFWKNGHQVDPLREKFPPSKPLPEEKKGAFEVLKYKYMKALDMMKWPDNWNREMAIN